MFYVIRRKLVSPVRVQYVSKHGTWDPDFAKARIFANMGAVKNSISHWPGTGDDDAEIVGLALMPTGDTITVAEAMAPLKERRMKQIEQRRKREADALEQRELAELQRLLVKYNP